MIDRRFILYILLGVVAFALWEAWKKDYNVNSAASTVTAAATTTIASQQATGGASIVATEQTGAAARVIQKQAIVALENRLIKVRTDVLDVAIDLVGGNVVQADLLKYPEMMRQEKPTRLLNNDAVRYYVAESGLISALGPDSLAAQAQYASPQKEYVLDSAKDSLKIRLLWQGAGGVSVAKIFTFTKGKYDIAVDYEIDNGSKKQWSGQFYTQIKRKDFDSSKSLFQFSTYIGAAISSQEKPYEKMSFSDIEDATKNKKEFIRDNQGGWIAMQQRYFLSVWVPAQDKIYRYFRNANNGIYTIGLTENIAIPAGKKETIGAILYAGPGVTENIAPLARGLDHTVDYGWLWIISVGFFWVLKNIYKLIGNWGWSIVLLTILIKLVFYKLSESSCRSMAKMRELVPKMQALKERYADDRQRLHQATMELYKQEKINPLNFGGCLPMLIQIPFFIALYYVLIGAVELRHAPFMLWIQDLSSRDPYYVLPILMGLSMFLQQRLSPASPDPTQAKMMMFMPVVFTLFFMNFPSGLVLYWLVNNLLSVWQQWYINKKLTVGAKVCRR